MKETEMKKSSWFTESSNLVFFGLFLIGRLGIFSHLDMNFSGR